MSQATICCWKCQGTEEHCSSTWTNLIQQAILPFSQQSRGTDLGSSCIWEHRGWSWDLHSKEQSTIAQIYFYFSSFWSLSYICVGSVWDGLVYLFLLGLNNIAVGTQPSWRAVLPACGLSTAQCLQAIPKRSCVCALVESALLFLALYKGDTLFFSSVRNL